MVRCIRDDILIGEMDTHACFIAGTNTTHKYNVRKCDVPPCCVCKINAAHARVQN